MSDHREIPVKVNALVDEGVACLVTALSAFPLVQTTDSCQGDGPKGAGPSVFFHVAHSDDGATVPFVCWFMPALRARVGNCAQMRLWWTHVTVRAVFYVEGRPSDTRRVAHAIRVLAAEQKAVNGYGFGFGCP